jgi:hypothetical protein
MAVSKERGTGAKKKTRRRTSTSTAIVATGVQKKTRKARTASPAAKRKRPSRPAQVDLGQKDFFGETNAVSPQVRQSQVQRGSLVLAPTMGHSNLLLVSSPTAPPPSPRRRMLYLLLLLLLMVGSFWLGRFTYHPVAGAPVDFQSQAPASGTVPASSTAPVASTAAVTPAPATHTAAGRPKTNIASAIVASIKAKVAAIRRGSDTALREVSVGTSSRGGITLKFDRPVSWTVKDNGGRGEAEVDIAGVRNLGTFPRNLPLPPGVIVIHAGITGPDTLRLWFTLLPNLRAFTSPDSGPSQVLNVYFRTDDQGSTAPALPQAIQSTGGCGSSVSAEETKAIMLLEQSLDKNPTYSDVRNALSMLETCSGDGGKAEQLLADGLKLGGGNSPFQITVSDAALRFARGDYDGSLQVLKADATEAKADPGFAELTSDLQVAAGKP